MFNRLDNLAVACIPSYAFGANFTNTRLSDRARENTAIRALIRSASAHP